MPPPPREVRIDNAVDRISSSRKKRNHDMLSPRTFLIGIVFAASMLLALSVYLTNQIDGQSPVPVKSSNAAVRGGAIKAVTSSEGDDTVRPVICNELLNDSTLWDPSKLHHTLFLSRCLFYYPLCTSHNNFCHATLFYMKIKIQIKMR